MKRIIAVLLVIVAILTLSSCADILGSDEKMQDNEFIDEIKQHIEDERKETIEETIYSIVMEAILETTETATKEETTIKVETVAPVTTVAETSINAETISPVISVVTQYEYERNTEPIIQTQSLGVFITPTGECYHFDPDCGGKNSFSTTLELAKSQGYRPCKKCAGG